MRELELTAKHVELIFLDLLSLDSFWRLKKLNELVPHKVWYMPNCKLTKFICMT